MRVRWKALIPVLGVIGVWLASPEALAVVGDRWTHVMLAASTLILALTPALVTNRPKSKPRQRKQTRDLEERVAQAVAANPPEVADRGE